LDLALPLLRTGVLDGCDDGQPAGDVDKCVEAAVALADCIDECCDVVVIRQICSDRIHASVRRQSIGWYFTARADDHTCAGLEASPRDRPAEVTLGPAARDADVAIGHVVHSMYLCPGAASPSEQRRHCDQRRGTEVERRRVEGADEYGGGEQNADGASRECRR